MIDYRVSIDEKKFQQVLLNYAQNAVKYSNQGGGKIKVSVYFINHQSQNDEFIIENQLNIDEEERNQMEDSSFNYEFNDSET